MHKLLYYLVQQIGIIILFSHKENQKTVYQSFSDQKTSTIEKPRES